jgi:PAS domain S-box-containing protein
MNSEDSSIRCDELEARCAELERALAEAHSRFNLVLEATNDGVWDWDLVRDEVMFSARWKAILGYAGQDIENTSSAFFNLIHAEDQSVVQLALERREPYNVEFRMLTKSGDYRIIQARGQAIWSDDGRPLRMAGTHTDITQANERAHERIRVKEQLKARDETIRALATPLLDLGDGMLCLPLLGAVDSERTRELTSTVLDRVVQSNARALIVDLTAAVLEESATTFHLIQLLRAVNLIGAHCSLCGIRPELAQQLSAQDHGARLDEIPVYHTLGEALRAVSNMS